MECSKHELHLDGYVILFLCSYKRTLCVTNIPLQCLPENVQKREIIEKKNKTKQNKTKQANCGCGHKETAQQESIHLSYSNLYTNIIKNKTKQNGIG